MWHLRAKHCPLCGAILVERAVHGRPRRGCGSCEFVLYANPASAAAGVVFNERSELLLVRRALQPFRGFWALPAGYQEIDEAPEETVRREVREETGIDVSVLGLLDLLFVADDPRKPANVSVFLCREQGGELRAGDEEEDVAWFPLDGLPERIGFENSPRILERLARPEGYPGSPWEALRRLLRGPGR